MPDFQVEAGHVSLGKSNEESEMKYYGWDDEYGSVHYDINKFQVKTTVIKYIEAFFINSISF